MTRITLIFFSISFSSSAFCQIPRGRYFDELKETVWISSENINDTTVYTLKEVSLRIWEQPIDSLNQNSCLWIFNDSLTITNYNKLTHKFSGKVSCKYKQNKEQKLITLIFANNDTPELKFNYLSISTGSIVSLYRDKKKNK